MVGDFLSQAKEKKRIKKRRARKKGPYIIVLIIVLYFISRMPPLLLASSQSTYPAEYGKIEKNIEATGYVAREEKVFTSVGKGDVKYFVSEGEKVAKGEKLAEVYLDRLDDKSRKDLESINSRLQNIKEKQDDKNVFQGDIKKLDQQILTLLKSIQQDLSEQRYDRITSMKEELEDLLNKKSIIIGEKSFSGKNISQLEQQKIQLEDKVNSSVQVIYSDSPGFVAMGSDGFEELLNYKTLHEINSDQLKMLKNAKLNLPSKDLEENAPVIRIVENYKWSIIVELDAKQADTIEKGKIVRIRITDKNKELRATVRNIIEEDNKKIVIFDLNEFMDDFYNIRTLTVEIIQNRYEGAMVANSSIVEKDGIKGVYIVDVNGIAKFKPIKIKTSNQEYSILHDGYFEVKSKDDPEKTEKVSTINLYDEIVMNGNKANEGQRVR